MMKARKKKIEVNECETCKKEILGDPPFSIIRFPMPYFCSMECLETSERKK